MNRAERRARTRTHKSRTRRMARQVWHKGHSELTPETVGRLASHNHTCGLCCGPRHAPYGKGADRLSVQERRVWDTVPV